MGMDLEPINPSEDAPLVVPYGGDSNTPPSEPKWGRYNWSGWSRILELLGEWGVDTTEFSGSNDGDEISAETCLEVANAIEKHLHELTEDERSWLSPHVRLWRTCGGYRQF